MNARAHGVPRPRPRRGVAGALLAACLWAPGGAPAQEPPSGPEAVEAITVTGSRIPRKDLEAAAPVTVLSREEIDRSGATSIGQLLRELPSVAGQAQTTQANNGGAGTQQISLRGLGSVRTLVLLNGRRLPPSVDSGAAVPAVDLNTLPTLAIERVEVLKDGASAIYGSDAVAGVVNLITRRNFEGVELNAGYGDTDRGGGSKRELGLVAGGGSETANWMFVGQYTDEEEIEVTDRDWATVPLFVSNGEVIFLGSTAPPWGRYRSFGEADAGRDCNGDGVLEGNCDLTLGPEYGAGFRRFDYFGGDSYNYAPSNYQRQPNERWNASFFGDARLEPLDALGWLEDTQVYLEASYTNRKSQAKLAEVPLAPLAFYAYEAPYAADNAYNPFGTAVPDWSRRMVEDGSRIDDHDEDTLRLLAGLRGEFEGALEGWRWDLSYTRAESERKVNFGRIYDLERVARAVGPTTGSPETGDLRCAADPDGCVPLNVFGRGSVTPEMLAYLTFTTDERLEAEQDIWELNFFHDALFELPAGPLGVALGYQRREESAKDLPDPRMAALGDATTGTTRQPTGGGFEVDSLYLEAVVPMLRGLPLAEELDLELAVRHSDYDTFGSTTDPKFGLKWRPHPDWLLRATRSDAFRSPTVGESFGGAGISFPSLTDPCAGGRMGGKVCLDPRVPDAGFEPISTQIRERRGGNPELDPEQAEIFTLGFVFTPGELSGLSLALDYYEVDIDRSIQGLGPEFILRTCASSGRLCDRIERFADGNVRLRRNRVTNVGGVMLGFAGIEAGWLGGEIDARLGATRTLEFDVIQSGGSVIRNAGWFRDDHGGHFAKWRATLGLDYRRENLRVSWDARFIDEVKEAFVDQFTGEVLQRKMSGRTYHDLQAAYDLELANASATLVLGIDNLFDRDPPFSLDASNDNTDVRTFDTVGRYFYLKVATRF
ncbi:MAG: TonB-dependent receptor [Proteobacteria bacterium]|nr:TonB-dependent receptor [Pseudomonadota bacterium]